MTPANRGTLLRCARLPRHSAEPLLFAEPKGSGTHYWAMPPAGARSPRYDFLMPKGPSASERSDFRFDVKHTLVVRGFAMDPSRLVDVLGVRPTRTVRVGDTDPARPHWVAKQSLWEHETPERSYNTAAVSDERHLQPLIDLARLAHHRMAELRAFVGSGELFFYTVTFSDSPNVVAHLPHETTLMIN